MEQKIPRELTMNVLKFCRHPVAELLQPLMAKHEFYRSGFREYCEKKGRPDNSHVFECPMVVFMHRRIEKGKGKGVDPKTTVYRNADLVNKYT